MTQRDSDADSDSERLFFQRLWRGIKEWLHEINSYHAIPGEVYLTTYNKHRSLIIKPQELNSNTALNNQCFTGFQAASGIFVLASSNCYFVHLPSTASGKEKSSHGPLRTDFLSRWVDLCCAKMECRSKH